MNLNFRIGNFLTGSEEVGSEEDMQVKGTLVIDWNLRLKINPEFEIRNPSGFLSFFLQAKRKRCSWPGHSSSINQLLLLH